ncbi:MAG TPA: peptidylprolyl isomerase [Coriobacteriia bacterium]|nr:peptidylprolyl isomerase [Coriobacteriia bacterium]
MTSVTTRTLTILTLTCVLGLLVAGCSAGTGTSTEPDQMHGDAPLSSGQVTETPPTPQEAAMHVSDVQVSGTETAVIATPKGDIVVEFYAEDAPNTVASFIELADAGFYNGIKFHRIVPSFVVQGGDPQTRDLSSDAVREIVARQAQGDYRSGEPMIGTGGPGWTQKAEFNSRLHERGTLAMARSQAVDSAGSQFYICLEPQPRLDGQYTVFGRVVEGMEIVDALEVGDEIVSLTIRR